MGKEIDNIFKEIDSNLKKIKEGGDQNVAEILNDIKELENEIDKIVQNEKVERFEELLDVENIRNFFDKSNKQSEKMEKFEKYLTWVANKNHYIAKNFKTNILIKMEDNLNLMKKEERDEDWGNEHTLSKIHEVETMIHMYGESEIKNEELFKNWDNKKNEFLKHFVMPSEKTYCKVYKTVLNILTKLKKVCTEKSIIKKVDVEKLQTDLYKIPKNYPKITEKHIDDPDQKENVKLFTQWADTFVTTAKKIITNQISEDDHVPPVPQIFLQKFPYVWSDLSEYVNNLQQKISGLMIML